MKFYFYYQACSRFETNRSRFETHRSFKWHWWKISKWTPLDFFKL